MLLIAFEAGYFVHFTLVKVFGCDIVEFELSINFLPFLMLFFISSGNLGKVFFFIRLTIGTGTCFALGLYRRIETIGSSSLLAKYLMPQVCLFFEMQS